jgi:predicted ATPase
LWGGKPELIALHGLTWNGRVVVISGDAGIGKTRLASEYLRRSNAFIIHATAFEGINTCPIMYSRQQYAHYYRHPHSCRYAKTQFWHLSGNANYAAYGELPGGDPDAFAPDYGETRLPEAVALLIQYLGKQRRVAIFVDDAQWLDDASARIMTEFMRRGLELQWQLIITVRSGDPSLSLQRLLSHAQRQQLLTSLTLDPLNAYEAQELAQQLNPQVTAHMVERAEGNPFMLVELLRHSDSTTTAVPAAIRHLIANRINTLRPIARRFIDAAAIYGREFDVAHTQAMADLTTAETLDALDELSQQGIIRMLTPQQGRFDHVLTMESIIAQAGQARIAHLHQRLADYLAQQTPPPHPQIAQHYTIAGLPDLATPHALAAARQAQQLRGMGRV